MNKLVRVDECSDANGFYTLRWADGTPNGDTQSQPLATIFDYEVAQLIQEAVNGERRPQRLKFLKQQSQMLTVS